MYYEKDYQINVLYFILLLSMILQKVFAFQYLAKVVRIV